MGIPDHLTCLLRNLYAGQKATVRTGHRTTDWFQIGKGVHQGYILSPCLFNLYEMLGWKKHKLELRLPGEVSITYPFSSWSSRSRNQTGVSCLAGAFFTNWAIRGALKVKESCSAMSSSLQPYGLYSPWNSPGQNAGVGSLSLLQGIFSN